MLLRCLCLFLFLSPAWPTDSPHQFLHLSDLHWDPYYGSRHGYKCTTAASAPYGEYGCDTPKALLLSALNAAKAAIPDPDFIVITGDFVRHAADTMPHSHTSALEAVGNVTQWIRDAFGDTSILMHHFLPTVGNNDVVPDYNMQVPTLPNATGDYYLEHLALLWQDLLPADALETFRRGGYYYHEVLKDLFVVSINTVVYSPNHEPDTEDIEDPFGQFEWLQSILHQAQQQGAAVYIIGHIPPIVDSWAHNLMWVEYYTTRYLQIVEHYRHVIRAQLFGHVHGDEFRTFELKAEMEFPIFISGSVTPVYDCNPSFRIWDFDASSKALLDYTIWSTDLPSTDYEQGPVWSKEYSARQRFGLRDMSNIEYRQLAQKFATDDVLWDLFRHVYYAGAPFLCDSTCRKEVVCLFLHMRADDFATCANITKPSQPTSPTDEGITPDVTPFSKFRSVLARYCWWILGSFLIVLFINVLLLSIWCFRHKHPYRVMQEPQGAV